METGALWGLKPASLAFRLLPRLTRLLKK